MHKFVDTSGFAHPARAIVDANGRQIVVGSNVVVTATLTRPNDSTAYAAKDAVSDSTSAPTVLTFAGMAGLEGAGGYIVKARLATNQASNIARFRLHLYTVAPTAINDNAPFTLLWANRASYAGYIDFDAASTEGTGSDAAQSLNAATRLPFVCAAGSKALYGLLEALDAFTPAAQQAWHIQLLTEQN